MLKLVVGGVVGAGLVLVGLRCSELVLQVPTARDVRLAIEHALNWKNQELKDWARRGKPLADQRKRLVEAYEKAKTAEEREATILDDAADAARKLWQ